MIIREQVEQTIQRFKMLKSNDRVVVAVSGGPDSVALLYLLTKLKKKWRLYLHVAHLNHRLRREAEQDQIFVQKLAAKLKLPFSCAQVEVEQFAQGQKLSIEQAARQLRYDFLLKVAQENSAGKIALGHNRDDQAETILMRFLRGSGISGLRGIPAKRVIGKATIIRPLIEVERRQIVKFLQAKNITFCTDSSNLQSVYLRNKIRLQLLPYLKRDFNPNIEQVLVNLAENVSSDFAYLNKKAEQSFKLLRANSSNGKVQINLDKFMALDPALQKLVARLAIVELKSNTRRIDYRHWQELAQLCSQKPKNSVVDLPGGVSVVKQQKQLVFYHRGPR